MAAIIRLWIRYPNRKGSVHMKIVAKKVIIYSMLGLMQVGMFSSVAAASPRHEEPPRFEQRNDQHQRDMERERAHKIQEENKRHEKEMKRYPFESKKHWRERQKHEMSAIKEQSMK